MTQTVEQSSKRRDGWIARVENLIAEISGWAAAEGWAVERGQKLVQEKALGEYEVPTLRVHLNGGELAVDPIALDVTGGDGRVDLEAFPTLSRVKFMGRLDGWQIITDSNVPLRVPWNAESFAQLARDLLS
jgi:hypothetical protein